MFFTSLKRVFERETQIETQMVIIRLVNGKLQKWVFLFSPPIYTCRKEP
jgi:hypothetical protein